MSVPQRKPSQKKWIWCSGAGMAPKPVIKPGRRGYEFDINVSRKGSVRCPVCKKSMVVNVRDCEAHWTGAHYGFHNIKDMDCPHYTVPKHKAWLIPAKVKEVA